jgi:hypothetical protein
LGGAAEYAEPGAIGELIAAMGTEHGDLPFQKSNLWKKYSTNVTVKQVNSGAFVPMLDNLTRTFGKNGRVLVRLTSKSCEQKCECFTKESFDKVSGA